MGAQGDRFFFRRVEVLGAIAICLNEDDLALRADGRDHLDIEIDLDAPVSAGRRGGAALGVVALLARLVVLRKVCGAKPEVAAIGRQICSGVGLVECIHDCHDVPSALAVGREVVARLVVDRAQTRDRRRHAAIRGAFDDSVTLHDGRSARAWTRGDRGVLQLPLRQPCDADEDWAGILVCRSSRPHYRRLKRGRQKAAPQTIALG